MTRIRVVSDNDYSGDPDGLFQLAHHLLSSSVDLRLVIGSHLAPGDPWDPSELVAANAARLAREVADAAGRPDVRIVAGSETRVPDRRTPVRSDAALALVDEAMREDDRPLYVVCGAGLTELASAWLLEPAIAERLTVVWIGGHEYPGLATPPPGAPAVEYNTNIDPVAAQVVFDSDLRLWQVPRDAYRQALFSQAELDRRVRPHGPLGRLLAEHIDRIVARASEWGRGLGETYVYGDSPLVLLTALQSSFEPDASSSSWVTRPAPQVRDDGTFDFAERAGGGGREIRVFHRLDTRLMFEDLFVKLEAHAAR